MISSGSAANMTTSALRRRHTVVSGASSSDELPPSADSTIARKRTSFSTISVREYNQTLGDSPSCLEGAPVSLDWTYKYEKSVSLDEYESNRQQRRRRSDLVMGAVERRKLLIGNGLSFLDIIRAERLVALKNNSSNVSSIEKQMGEMKLKDNSVNAKPCPRIASKKRSVVSRAA